MELILNFLYRIKRVTFFIFGFFFKKYIIRSKTENYSTAIIRLDAIGDYVLFRSLVEEAKGNNEAQTFILIGNEQWKDLAQKLDENIYDHFIWIDKNRLWSDFSYFIKKIREIRQFNFELLASSTHSRDFWYNDFVSLIVNSKYKIASNGDNLNISLKSKRLSDLFFNKLISVPEEIDFEFLKNKYFFSRVFKMDFFISKPTILLEDKIKIALPQKYAVINIGASNPKRKWAWQNYACLIKLLKSKYRLPIVICGGPGDVDDSKKIEEEVGNLVHNLAGKTSLYDLLHVLNGAEFLVSNETNAPHMAVALGVKQIFVISNGNHYKRFTPYPKSIFKNYYPVYHDGVRLHGHLAKDMFKYESNLDIHEVPVSKVINEIEKYQNIGHELEKEVRY